MTLHTLLDRFDLLMDTPESVSKLRQFILRLAVRGNLTDRKQTDTPAEVLLEQVHERKWDLYEKGEIRKPKEVDSVSGEEALYELPGSWTWARFNNVATIVSDRVDPQNHPDKPHVSPASVEKKSGKLLDYNTIREDGVTSSKSRFQPGQIVYSKIRPNLAKAIIAEFEGLCSADMYPIRSHIETGYLHWYMLSEPFTAQVTVDDNRVAMPKTNQSELRRVVVPLPPLEEQQRIVGTVDRLMDECDALEQQQERERTLQVQVGTAATEALQSADGAEALRPAWERVREHFDTVTATPEGVNALRQSILQLAVQGRLTERDPDDTPADALLEQIQQEKQRLYDAGEIRKPKVVDPVSTEEEPYTLPEGWTWARFNDVATIISDRVDPTNHPDKPHVSPASVEKKTGVLLGYNTIREDGVTSSKSRFQRGHIVYSKIRPNLSKAVIADFEGLCSADMYPIRSHIETSYLHYYMLSGPFTAQVTDDDNRVAMPKTNQSELRRVAVALPPSGEQQRITESIDRLLPLCDDLEDLLSKTNERGEQLLKAALKNASMDRQAAVPTDAVGANS